MLKNAHLRWLWLAFLTISVVSGCAGRSRRAQSCANMIAFVPQDKLAGFPWDLKLVPRAEVSALLGTRMPDPRTVSRDQTLLNVLEDVTHKKIVWIPELEPDQMAAARDSYRNWSRASSSRLGTVRSYLEGLVGGAAEGGLHRKTDIEPLGEKGEYIMTYFVDIIFFTKSDIVIVAFPVRSHGRL